MRLSVAALAAAVGVVAAIKAPIEGYTVVDMQWEIEVFPGRVEILNGTIQEAYRQAKEMNPEFDPELPLPEASRALEARGLQRRSTVKCGGWPTGYFQTLYRVIQLDIRPRKGIARNPPGPGACSRPGCDRSGTVWWCNDNATPLEVTYDAIANSALHILEVCGKFKTADGKIPMAWKNMPEERGPISGQNFEDGKWNTIVRGQDGC